MGFQANVLKVMIASPGDVATERAIIVRESPLPLGQQLKHSRPESSPQLCLTVRRLLSQPAAVLIAHIASLPEVLFGLDRIVRHPYSAAIHHAHGKATVPAAHRACPLE
jgi:hypothetical protein